MDGAQEIGIRPSESVSEAFHTFDQLVPSQYHSNSFPDHPLPSEDQHERSIQTQTISQGDPVNLPKKRKKKAPTLRAQDWEPHKARIIELHIEQNMELKRVKETMERERGFKAELRQYRTRISQWGLDKKVKTHEMKKVVEKQQRRRLVETGKKDLCFTVRGQEVEQAKIDRWMRRQIIPNSSLYVASPPESTPSAMFYQTASETCSSFASPASLMESPRSPSGIIAPTAPSSQPLSPSPSISSMLQNTTNFEGQSPAPIYEHVPVSAGSASPLSTVSSNQIISSYPHEPSQPIQYRYLQEEEDRLKEGLLTLDMLQGPNHPAKLETLSKLAEVYWHQGRYRSAEIILQRLVRSFSDLYGHHNINTLEALSNLGRIFLEQGLITKAERACSMALQRMKNSFGEEHLQTLKSVDALANVFLRQERWKEAEELETQVVEGRKRLLGDEHPMTLLSTGNLSLIYLKQRKLKKAEELQLQVLEWAKQALGDKDPTALSYQNSLAAIYNQQNRLEEAETLQLQVLEGRKRILGDEHPDTLRSMAALASNYLLQRRLEEAELLQLQALKMMNRVLGDKHPCTLLAMSNLALTHSEQKRWEESEALIGKVVGENKVIAGGRAPHPRLL